MPHKNLAFRQSLIVESTMIRNTLALALLAAVFASTAFAQTTSTWTGNAPLLPGGGADLSWHNPLNWNNGIVPNGAGSTAIVPDGFSVEVTGQIAIDNFSLGRDSILFNRELTPGTEFDVTTSASVEGNFVFYGFGGGEFELPALIQADNTDFDIGTGQTVHLPALNRLANSQVTVGTGARVALAGIMDSGTAITLTDSTSSVEFGDVQFNGGSSLSVPTTGTFVSSGDFKNNMTNEADLGIDDAIMLANGGATQLLEVGGQDLGAGGATSGNFGIGQLVIGEAAGPVTIVELSEVFDNGNRGPMGLNGEEALYLYGLGGPDGLRIDGDSVLALNSINVYAWDGASGQQVHLNSLFGPGDYRIPFGNGVLQLGLGGDFDGDNLYTCRDIDELVSRIVTGDHDDYFDLTGDGLVTVADRDQWLAEAGEATLDSGNPFLPGDANLDGAVDGDDFKMWNAHKFQLTSNWCDGDFNTDGAVDGQDFLVWNAFKFQSAIRTNPVPEPSAVAMLLVLVAGSAWLRPRMRCSQ